MDQAPKPYFLLSFLPALAYWFLETYFTLEIALTGGAALGILEMLLEKKLTGHVHTLSKLNLILILILGGISLIAQEGLFFKLQPTMTGLAVSSFLFYKKVRGQSLMLEMLNDMKQKAPLSPEFYQRIEWHMCLFLVGFSIFMAYVAVKESTATWLFWKTAGFYIAFGGFMVSELIYIRLISRKIRR